jgi:hypothetical protein
MAEGDKAIGRDRGQADAQAAIARAVAWARTKYLVASAIAAKAPGVVAQSAHARPWGFRRAARRTTGR